MQNKKAVIKWNNGMLAILCSKCRKMLRIGSNFTPNDWDYLMGRLTSLPPQYCEKCALKVAIKPN